MRFIRALASGGSGLGRQYPQDFKSYLRLCFSAHDFTLTRSEYCFEPNCCVLLRIYELYSRFLTVNLFRRAFNSTKVIIMLDGRQHVGRKYGTQVRDDGGASRG